MLIYVATHTVPVRQGRHVAGYTLPCCPPFQAKLLLRAATYYVMYSVPSYYLRARHSTCRVQRLHWRVAPG